MQSPLAHHLATMAVNNAWANHRLLNSCTRLSQAEFVAPGVSFFPSIKATLNHNLTVDWYYVDALERAHNGLPRNPDARNFFEPREPFTTCAELATAQRAVDRRLVTLCRQLNDERLALAVPLLRRTGWQVEPTTRLLAHLFQHQIHHRGQAHAMLAGTSVAPPQLDDFFCANDVGLCTAELAELGYDEAELWANR